MSTQLRAFRKKQGINSQNTALTAASQQVAINDVTGTKAIRFTNLGTSNAFIEFGTTSATAAVATSMVLPAGQTEIFTIGNDITHYAIIGDGTSSVIYSQVGEGL